jgi:hypothetical protein
MTSEEIDKQIKAIRDVTDKATQSRETARQFLIDAGIIQPTMTQQQIQQLAEEILIEYVGDLELYREDLIAAMVEMYQRATQPSPPTSRWVKVSERLPEKVGSYKVKTMYGTEYECCYFTGSSFTNYYGYGYDVVEWLEETNPKTTDEITLGEPQECMLEEDIIWDNEEWIENEWGMGKEEDDADDNEEEETLQINPANHQDTQSKVTKIETIDISIGAVRDIIKEWVDDENFDTEIIECKGEYDQRIVGD